MLTRMHLIRITGCVIVSTCLSGTACYAAQASPDVEMSTISGEAANPRRHYRLRDPERLDPERAAEIYAIVRGALGAGYRLSGSQVARDYQSWHRYNSAPYLSATHGNHYLNNYANARALAYGEFEGAGRLPVGSVIAKDSFSVTKSGGILLGSLFIMERCPRGSTTSVETGSTRW